MDLYLDTNVLLDEMTHRQPHYEASRKTCLLGITKEANVYINVNALTDLFYFLEKEYGSTAAQDILENNLSFLQVIGVTAEEANRALQKRWDDFEDCLVAESAAKINADYIVTRNICDFERSSVPAITPDRLFEVLHEQGFDYSEIDF